MNQEIVCVVVHLAGCDYRFSCLPGEREDLLEAAHYLDLKMREVRDQSAKPLTLEAVAVMAALNIGNDLLRQQRRSAEMDALVNAHARDLLQKIDVALNQAAATAL